MQARDAPQLATAKRRETCSRLPAPAPCRRRATDAAPTAMDLQSWNGFGGFDRDGRDYVVRLGRPAHDAASLDQRHLQPVVRLPYLGRGRFLHLEPQQPRFPADAMVKRSGDQPAGRGDLRPRPCQRQGILALRRRRCAIRSTIYEARHGQGFSTFTRQARAAVAGADATGRPGRSGEDVAADASAIPDRSPARLRVYAYAEWVLGNNRAQIRADHRAGAGCGDRRTSGAQSLQPGFRRRVAFLAGDGAAAVGDGGPPRIHRAGRHRRVAAGGAAPAPPCPAGSRRAPIHARRSRATSRCPPAAR